VEIGFQLRHVPIKKAAVLANAVSANGRLARRHPLLEEGQGLALGLRHADGAFADPLGQA